MDFTPLLSREYRPARLAELVVKERKPLKRRTEESSETQEEPHAHSDKNKGHNKLLHDLQGQTEEDSTNQTKELEDEELGRLALQLVSKTPAYTRHLKQEEGTKIVDDTDLKKYITKPKLSGAGKVNEFPPAYHQVELGNWELGIDWDGCGKTQSQPKTSIVSSRAIRPVKAEELLKERRNPLLENISFDDIVSWSGSKEDVKKKAMQVPLVLELGITGQSIAPHVLPSHRPLPCVKSEEYQTRIQADWTGEIKSTAELAKGTLHADKDKTERFIQQRQEKRHKMEKAKTNRVLDAMSTIGALRGGRGRTITR